MEKTPEAYLSLSPPLGPFPCIDTIASEKPHDEEAAFTSAALAMSSEGERNLRMRILNVWFSLDNSAPANPQEET